MTPILHLHAGDLGTYRHCPRKFYWDKIARIKLSTASVPTFFNQGSIGHLWLKGFYTKQPVAPETLVPEYKQEDVDYIYKLLENYGTVYPNDLERYEILSCEDSIPVQLGNQTLLFTIDLKVLDRETGSIVLFDHKFYKSQAPSPEALYCNSQPFTYFGLLENYVKQSAQKFFLNVIIKRSLKLPEPLKAGGLTRAKNLLSGYSEADYRLMLGVLNLDEKDYEEELLQLRQQDRAQYVRLPLARDKGREDYAIKQLLTTINLVEMAGDNRENYEMNLQYECDKCAFFHLCRTEISGNDIGPELEFYYEAKPEDVR